MQRAKTSAELFKGTSPELQALAKQANKENRLKRRADFKAQALARAATPTPSPNAQSQSTPD